MDRSFCLILLLVVVTASSLAAQENKPAESAPACATREQMDAILEELRQIRTTLQAQQAARPAAAAARPPAAPAANKVKVEVPKDAPALGQTDAPVTIVEFTDYQCPFCKRFENQTFAELKKNYIDTGKVRFVSRDLPLDIHRNAMAAAQAARCAAEQGKYWEMRHAMFAGNSDLGKAALEKHAQEAGLKLEPFQACMAAEKHKTAVQLDIAAAAAASLQRTPSFVIGKSSGSSVEGAALVGALPYATFENAINEAMKAPAPEEKARK